MRRFLPGVLALAAILAAAPAAAAGTAELLRRAIDAACPEAPASGALAAAVGAAGPAESEPLRFRGGEVGRRFTLPLEGGHVEVERFAPGGRLRRVSATYRAATPEGLRPVLLAIAGAECRVLHGRRLTYDVEGRREALVHLAPDLTRVIEREALNPPLPGGRDPGGVAVALVDSGVNYTLPFVARRLARGADGRPLGYDYWEMDARPFDGNPARSPFFPQRHGTAVASVLLREAPEARLVPYRYPRPAMRRMGDLVADAAAAGVRIVALPLGSKDRSDWETFAEAARGRDMLFVASAGNSGRNIDRRPVYPAALELDGLLTVTSSEDDGRLAAGSNWGAHAVDVMVPAEPVTVTDWRGHEGQAAGSSFAVPRVAALAARLLAANPGWSARELKAAILRRARPSPAHAEPVTRHGWIPDPAAD